MTSMNVTQTSARCVACGVLPGRKHVSSKTASCTKPSGLMLWPGTWQNATHSSSESQSQICSRRSAPEPLRAAPDSSAVETVDPEATAPPRPSSAETARTVLDLVAHGTLATIGEDGQPLGTYASYVLDGRGQPILRLRADAVHTANLLRQPSCSLFVQPIEVPARLLARVTLKGSVEEVKGPERDAAASMHQRLHGEGVGVDAPQESDLYYRLVVSECFYVGGLGAGSTAETLQAAEVAEAEPDLLRSCAATVVDQLNTERAEDVLRIAAEATKAKFDDLDGAQMLWVDRLGMYLFIQRRGAKGEVHRAPFPREVASERDARSMLTMLAQVSWENERRYTPVMPVLSVPEGSI